MEAGDKVLFPTGEGTLVIRDEDVNGVVIVHSESGEYQRVHMTQIKPVLTDEDRLVLEALDCLNHVDTTTEGTVRELIGLGYRKVGES